MNTLQISLMRYMYTKAASSATTTRSSHYINIIIISAYIINIMTGNPNCLLYLYVYISPFIYFIRMFNARLENLSHPSIHPIYLKSYKTMQTFSLFLKSPRHILGTFQLLFAIICEFHCLTSFLCPLCFYIAKAYNRSLSTVCQL